jgi:DNA-binding response OmpR family regulator
VANLKVLIIDDDSELNSLLSSYLGQFNFDVLTSVLPSEGLRILDRERPDLVVLDVMLPEKNGFEVCQEIRKTSRVPIIMLTARGDLSDRVVGLELGADDYLPKPYEPRELVARIQSVLRRMQAPILGTQKIILRSQELMLDLTKASADFSGVDLELTTAEFSVLRLLMENPGKTVSRDEITQAMRGGSHWDSADRTVDMIVSRLRNKLKDDSKHPRFLKTMWGEGYRFVGDVQDR